VTQALTASDSRGCSNGGGPGRNGHNLQHFCRELARYFRNLLVAKSAGGTPLIAASPTERAWGDRSPSRTGPDALPADHAGSVRRFADRPSPAVTELGLLRLSSGTLADRSSGDAGGRLTPPHCPNPGFGTTSGWRRRLKAKLHGARWNCRSTADACALRGNREEGAVLSDPKSLNCPCGRRPAEGAEHRRPDEEVSPSWSPVPAKSPWRRMTRNDWPCAGHPECSGFGDVRRTGSRSEEFEGLVDRREQI
jgi:hypothetical protein